MVRFKDVCSTGLIAYHSEYKGGGFNFAASLMHFDFFYRHIVQPFNESGHDVAFFFVGYTLTPCASYPTQLIQAAEALRYIIHGTKRPASSVMLGGDSAGGNLVLGLLLHLSHPHPDIEPISLKASSNTGDGNSPGGLPDIALDVDGVGFDNNATDGDTRDSANGDDTKLYGVILSSPWVSFSADWPSLPRNKRKDIIATKCLDVWSDAYLNGKQPDYWNEPLRTPIEWWKDVKTDQVLIIGGTDEVLVSAIEAFAKEFKVSKQTDKEEKKKKKKKKRKIQYGPGYKTDYIAVSKPGNYYFCPGISRDTCRTRLQCTFARS